MSDWMLISNPDDSVTLKFDTWEAVIRAIDWKEANRIAHKMAALMDLSTDLKRTSERVSTINRNLGYLRDEMSRAGETVQNVLTYVDSVGQDTLTVEEIHEGE